ncbi:hypothetical protein BLNAU_22178 [Blattamonas nauphoetae]|uniref:Uncharacterized protein n=1 Tax=Blattamonas nauphoetae TaxID=2049346 RepID=A0ABQ9WTU8_9EUKA|nr:hypothetical protein BLNAU_22178 [Blattamonas nauphoetae]
MATNTNKTDTSSSGSRRYCYAFMNWTYNRKESQPEKAVVFQSLVATVKLKPALDVSLEAKAVKFLKSVKPKDKESADAFLSSFASNSDDYSTNFVQSMMTLLSSTNQIITNAAMKMLHRLISYCSPKVDLPLIKADLIPQLINPLNPLSLSFTDAADIHTNLILIITNSVWLATPDGLECLKIKDRDEEYTVHETVLRQVVAPSEKYICHLCMNQFSIIDDEQSYDFLTLLARLLAISPCYEPTMDFVLNIPVILTIPSCLSFFENEHSIWIFLHQMIAIQREWNVTRGEVQKTGRAIHRMLRMEGFEDVIEEKLRTDKNRYYGGLVVARSITLNNLLGMNIPEEE